MISEAKLVSIAREIAMDIFPLEQILRNADVTWSEFDGAKENPRFLSLVEQFAAEWGSAMNTSQRIKVKSQAIIEDVLPDFFRRMTDKKEPFAAQVDALKTLRAMSGVGTEEATAGGGEKFHLEIHIGEAKPVVIDGKGFGDDRVTPGVIEHAPVRPREGLGKTLNFELAGGIDE
jgi:hypothetical protein